ncbi:MAG: DJ-1/PfpI family protein [Bacteroidales bacterium]|nr:DJ-1/PfpI family protein [Bacteroidales bacterium]
MKGVYVFLAEGFEEIEALTTVDILRRGGVPARTVSITPERTVTGAHGVPVCADLTRPEFDSISGAAEALVFPGGMPGTRNLASDAALMERMKEHFAHGGVLAAICAAPGLVVSQLPSLEGRQFTCYDGFEDAPMAKGGEYTGEPAVMDGNLVTGRGPGCAVEFALTLLEKLKGGEVAEEV